MSDPVEAHADGRPRALVMGAVVVNALLLAAAALVWSTTGSQLVLAQGSDSLLDIGAGLVLAVSAWVASHPGDENHPYGHERAEPIGALVTAIFAGVLAFEVLRSAVGSLVLGETARMDIWVAAVLGGKFVLKLGIWGLIRSARNGSRSQALRALAVDTRNDLVACASSLVGFGLARQGFDWADGALAIPVAFYIGASGFQLARENLRYLMGEAPDEDVLAELRTMAAHVTGVIEVGRLLAQYAGPTLQVDVQIVVAPSQSLVAAHDISVAVQRSLEEHELVGIVFVHVDTQLDGEEH